MNQIKTWQKRIHKLEGEQGDGFLTIQQAMQQEIDDLRQAIEQAGKVEPISSILTKWKTGMICGQDAMVLLFRHYSSDPATPTAPAQPAPGNTTCNPHPDAPHGFVRNASIAEDRYVCECEGWMPPAQRPLTRAEKNRIWSSCSGAATLPARASLFGTKIEDVHGITGETK